MKKSITIAGILLMVGSLIGLGITYRGMKLQRHLHDKLAGVRITLAEAGKESGERFTNIGDGIYTLHLSTITSARHNRTAHLPFDGMVEYSIADSGGRLRYLSRILPGSIPALNPDSATLVTLDTIYIPEAGSQLQLLARVITPDSNFAETLSEVFLMPPADPGFDDYVRRQSLLMALLGLTIIIGFCIMVFGGRDRRSP